MKCRKCGANVYVSDAVCMACGATVGGTQQKAASSRPQVAATRQSWLAGLPLRTRIQLCLAGVALFGVLLFVAVPGYSGARYVGGTATFLPSHDITVSTKSLDGYTEVTFGDGGEMGEVGGRPCNDGRGSYNIRIEVDPSIGYTQYAGLHFTGPCVVDIGPGGTLMCHSPGVTAQDGNGKKWVSRRVLRSSGDRWGSLCALRWLGVAGLDPWTCVFVPS